VPGRHGIALLLAGQHTRLGPPSLISRRWWTSRGALASHEKDENGKRLRQATQRWGRRVVHVFDRGYASRPWLGALHGFDARFIRRVARSITTCSMKQEASRRLGKSRVAKWVWLLAPSGMRFTTAMCRAACSSFPSPTPTFLTGR
jgi:hypothetical protein